MPEGLAWLDHLLALGVVVALLLGAAHLLARWRGRLVARGSLRLQHVESLGLDPRSRLVVVRWDGRELLLGVSAAGVTLLAGDRPEPRP